ncbi:MAG: hypothetical protein ACI4GB_09810 [Acutalibacteraceae bacterium]
MKKLLIVLFVIFTTLLLTACNQTDEPYFDEYGFKSEKYVYLPDYSNFEIQNSDYKATEEDIDRYIYFELFSKSLYDNEVINSALQSGTIRKYLTDQIAEKYYGKSSANDVIESIKHDLQRDRIWDQFYQLIIEHAYANNFPKQKDEYLDFKLNTLISIAEEKKMNPEEYLDYEYNLSLSEYRESLTYMFLEIMVIKAIADQEGIQCGINDYGQKIKEISFDEGIEENEVKKYYSKYDIYNEIYLDLLKEHMFNQYTKEFSPAFE